MNAASISLKRDPNSVSETYEGNFTINAYTNSTIIRAKQPNLVINGFIEGKMHGSFIFNRFYFYARPIQSSMINGNFTLKVLYNSGIIYAQINDIHEITEIIGKS